MRDSSQDPGVSTPRGLKRTLNWQSGELELPLPASLGAKRRENFYDSTIQKNSSITSLRERFFPITCPIFTRDLLAIDESSIK
ncbi:MAG: hypothetical protein ACLGG0_00690 [Bacteriovoracia bacterium]